MRVQAVMTPDVRTCTPDDSVNRAAELMWNGDCGFIPVLGEENRVVGVLTDRDICMAGYLQGRPLAEIQVASVMSKDIVSCRPSDTIAEAELTMGKSQVRRLPVIDASGALVGVVSLNDLARELERERGAKRADQVSAAEVAATLSAVCQPRFERETSRSLGC